ncbi:hypothetical protein DPMN_075209 [Dreissena polymorpha]|uniref:Uncharacterized protein n=1 Tax=Dreissena polymorpha TaxID=45954 RepID=A0A9D3YGD7_DREPO|nr:hypothetical protein DPMN_075209 [Dreissena polymorpha]
MSKMWGLPYLFVTHCGRDLMFQGACLSAQCVTCRCNDRQTCVMADILLCTVRHMAAQLWVHDVYNPSNNLSHSCQPGLHGLPLYHCSCMQSI